MGAISKAAKNVRILTIDIETSPNLAYVWGMFKQNVSLSQLKETSQIMCWVGKWYGSKETLFYSEHEHGYEAMIRAAHEAISEADIVVTYNGLGFDVPKLQTAFALLGMDPPAPHKNVDLLPIVRKQFSFTSNKLDHVVQQFKLGAKVQHTGFQLWLDCMAGDEKAWRLMEKYNRQDVVITEKLYDRLRAWIPNHPHFGMWATGEKAEWCCPNCGHTDVSKNRKGTAHTNVQRYRQYQCSKCGVWLRGTAKLKDPTRTRVAR